MNKLRIICWTAAALMAASAIPAVAQQAAKTKIDFLGARQGSYGYVTMYAVSAIVNKHSTTVEGVVQEAFGAADNLKRLDQDKELRKHAIAVTSVPAMYGARNGTPAGLFPKKITGQLNVFNTGDAVNWIATTQPNIKTPQDLAGKRFDSGPYGNFMGFIGDTVLQAYGAKEKVSAVLHTADQQVQYSGLSDGKVDAILTGSIAQGDGGVSFNSNVTQLLKARTIWPVDLSKEHIKKMREQSGIPYSPYNVAPGLPNKDAPGYVALAFALNAVAHEDMPEELVYEVVKQLIANVSEVGNYANQAKKAMTRETIAAIDVPVSDFHPGAIRAYREAGIKIGEENFK